MNKFGPLETATRDAIERLGVINGVSRSLAELAIILSRELDSGFKGPTGMAMSANSRELRETLKQMTEVSNGGNALDDLWKRLDGTVSA